MLSLLYISKLLLYFHHINGSLHARTFYFLLFTYQFWRKIEEWWEPQPYTFKIILGTNAKS